MFSAFIFIFGIKNSKYRLQHVRDDYKLHTYEPPLPPREFVF